MRRFCFCLIACFALSTPLFALQETEPNQYAGEANPFSIPETLTGNFITLEQDPWDYWSFSATGGVQYRFAATPIGSSFLYPLDLALDIEAAGGALLARADAGDAHASETLDWTAPSSGTFYLVVWEATGYKNPGASYSVSASILAPSSVDDWELY
jgi:hypothetical protein